MRALILGALLMTALAGTLVVVSRDPRRQVLALSSNGAMLGVLFFVLQAPDVAFSEIAVGTVVTPLLYLVALAAVRMNQGKP